MVIAQDGTGGRLEGETLGSGELAGALCFDDFPGQRIDLKAACFLGGGVLGNSTKGPPPSRERNGTIFRRWLNVT